jgi:hypothetical protein
VISVFSLAPVQDAKLGGALDAASGGLFDINVDRALFIAILLDGKVYGCERDCFARQPADALHGEDGISIVGESLVLWAIT